MAQCACQGNTVTVLTHNGGEKMFYCAGPVLGALLGSLAAAGCDVICSAVQYALSGEKQGFGIWRLCHDVHVDPSGANISALTVQLSIQVAAVAIGPLARLSRIHAAAKIGARPETTLKAMRCTPRTLDRIERQVAEAISRAPPSPDKVYSPAHQL